MAHWRSVRRNGTFVKWLEVGQTLEGVYSGKIEGKYGEIGKILTEQGEVLFPVRTVLALDLASVKANEFIRITYLGEKWNEKSKRTYKDFDVQTLVEDGKAEDDDVPFDLSPGTEEGRPVDDPGPARTDREAESALATADVI